MIMAGTQSCISTGTGNPEDWTVITSIQLVVSVSDCVKRLINSFVTSSAWAPGPLCATGLCDRVAVMDSPSFSECGASASTEGPNKEGAVTDETRGGKKTGKSERGWREIR